MFGRKDSSQPKSTKKIVLPHQESSPNFRQLQKMQDETLHGTGVTVQLSFGSAPELFTIVVFRDPLRGIVQWSFYRGDGNNSQLEWQQATSDVNWINNLIEVAYPQIQMTKKTLAELSLPESPAQVSSALPVVDRSVKDAAPKNAAQFEGDLENVNIPTIIQSLEMNDLTGRLELICQNRSGEIFFVEGKPVHSVLEGDSGESAIVELCSWDTGRFKFFKEDACKTRTVNKPVHYILMAGAALLDQMIILKKRGVFLDSFLVKRHNNMTITTFKKLLENGTGVNEELQFRFYELVDGYTPIVGILRQLPMPKMDWVPIVFNLITCSLCSVAQTAAVSPVLENLGLGETEQVRKLLSNPDTGIYTGSAYIYFLSNEMHRYTRFKHPFSTLIVNLRLKGSNEEYLALDADAFRQLGEQLSRMCRRTDMFFHFGAHDLAFIAPNTDLSSAHQFSRHLSDILGKTILNTQLGSFQTVSAIGCASIPDSCDSIDALVRLAQPNLSPNQ